MLRVNEVDLSRIDLNLLVVFAALVETRSVRRSAKRLSLGASAVSMALGRLRQTFGDPLFVRAAQEMRPTPRAQALWTEVAPALDAIRNAVAGARSFEPSRAELAIRFAAPDDLEFVLVPRLLERLEREAPGVRLVLRPADFRSLIGRLDEADADVALSARPTSGVGQRHRVRRLHEERFSVLYDEARLGRSGRLPLDTYVATPHVLLSVTGDQHGVVDDALERLGRTRTVVATVAHFPTIPFVLRRRRALANVPTTAARHFAKTYGLARCALPFPSPTFDLVLVWHARTDADPAHAWFRALVTEVVAELTRAPV